MPPTKTKRSNSGKKSSSKSKKDEIQQSKSPAEFFAENQSIAGFDNAGKSLYTTLRELIENSLDACESVNVLPDISVTIEEMTQAQFNKMRGVPTGASPAKPNAEEADDVKLPGDDDPKDKDKKGKGKKARAGGEAYFIVTVRDNGCGMAHEAIPDLLGRVLSGSKYGVRQTRGKFGLGAKMALIWSKKSTGVPIKIKTSHVKGVRGGGGGSLLTEEGERKIGPKVSSCVLDIDIYKNCPRVLEHKQQANTEKWIGTEMEVLVAGNWTTYKSRVVQYLQQLAIITPYASLGMDYSNRSDEKKEMTLRFERRSEQMPAQAREVKHHPSSVNNLLIQQLLERTSNKTLFKFLTNDLSGISPSAAKKLIQKLGNSFDGDMGPDELDDKQTTRLVQLLRSTDGLFKSPDGGCLSPLGEYNLNLGIQKVVEPEIIATARDKPGAYDGHPFIVEAAVSLGGNDAKEGITVVRFANRIPLLFEGGADVATRVANSKIKWSSYKIDHKKDRIGVFVSIVSTKVPFKGTGKEYIGDDITEIQLSVKRALQSCCQQLRAHLAKRNALRDVKERKSRLLKYVPDVSRSLFGILEGMRKRKLEEEDGLERVASPRKRVVGMSPAKRLKSSEREKTAIMNNISKGNLTEDMIKQHLIEAVEETANAGIGDNEDEDGGKSKSKSVDDERQSVYLVPIYDKPNDVQHAIQHPLFDFFPINVTV
mmetsp:Transcript_26030/g.55382  ORF Transcript_26030/g.55382 Transcript_26030/m.55382 type:complete len:708 (+) Transcript_26030:220-2343(+)